MKEKEIYRKRFERHHDELRWLYMELYDNGSMFAELCDHMERFYEERNGELKSSDEGKVFWTQLDALPQMPTIWHMDHMLRIFDKEEFAELFLDTEQDWKPILK